MSDTYNITDGSGMSAVASLAVQAAEPVELNPGVLYAVPGKDGDIVLLEADQFAEHPRHTRAARKVSDAASFVAYVQRHGIPGTEVYAHTLSSSVVAIIDSHEGAALDPGWQKHSLTLDLEHTKAWRAWASNDLTGERPKWFGQAEFAEFIEDRALDVLEPDHAVLIDLATTFEAKKSAEFTASTRLDNGDVRLDYAETTTASAGKGSVEIPKRIRLGLKPYVGGPTYSVWAAFRYRLRSGTLSLGYALERPENILEAAFADIVTEIREGKTVKPENGEEKVIHTGIGDVPIFYGKPA